MSVIRPTTSITSAAALALVGLTAASKPGEAAVAALLPARKNRTWLLAAAIAFIGTLAPNIASAEPRLSIDEGVGLPNPLASEGTLGLETQNFTSGNGLISVVRQEATGITGFALVNFRFFSSSAPAPGVTIINNTELFDPNGSLSDTVEVNLGGILLDANGNNVEANIAFASDSLDGSVPPPPLSNAARLGENGFFQLIDTGVPVADLNFSVRSDTDVSVPEPTSLFLLGTALLVCVCLTAAGPRSGGLLRV
jgi:hypothetical protein